jgi:dephospho-CoA kinase
MAVCEFYAYPRGITYRGMSNDLTTVERDETAPYKEAVAQARRERPPMNQRKPVVGLSGGIGAGKSEVARILAELGAGVIDSDEINRQELENAQVRDTLIRWWGDQILTPEGRIDRSRVAALVFDDEAQRNRLEALMHPRIAVRRRRLIDEYQQQPQIRMIVLNSPLLYETGLDALCDGVIFIDAPEEVRAARTGHARGWSLEEFRRRQNLQYPLDFKRARADYICQNHSDMFLLRRQVETIYSRIVSAAEFVT